MEQQRARFLAQVHTFSDVCWDKCVGTPGSKLSRGEESCLQNCVDRFLDTSYFIVNRLEELKKHS